MRGSEIEIFRQAIATGDDIFLIRQRAREIAAASGFDDADQVRIATALSEVGRDALSGGRESNAVFEIHPDTEEFVIRVDGVPAAMRATSQGIAGARRLMSEVAVEVGNGDSVRVVLSRRLPGRTTEADVLRVRTHIATRVAVTPLDELRRQNQQLISTIEEVQAARESLGQLNAELEETNKGVMAMYAQLSDELDSTNRGVVALYREIDDKTRQIEAASTAKSQFLSSVSHELRGPATSILGLAGLLADPFDGVSVPEHRRQVELIADSATELLDLVSQLLDLAKAESGRLDPAFARVDLIPVLAEVISVSRPLAADAVTLELVAPPTLVVLTDERLLRQVIRNLVVNALAFTETGFVRVVAAAEPDRSSVIDVVDSGIGLSAEDVDRVFEEFFQVRNRLQSRRRGSGLGLPYSRRVVETLGGQLTASSVPGAGSAFRVWLPERDPDHDMTTPTGARAPTAFDATASSAPRVLVIDDDPSFRSLVTQLLDRSGARTLEAATGADGIALFAAHDVDLVLLDLHLPDMAGTDVLDAITSGPRRPDTPVAVITSQVIDDGVRAHARSASAILPKDDVTGPALEALVRSIVPGT